VWEAKRKEGKCIRYRMKGHFIPRCPLDLAEKPSLARAGKPSLIEEAKGSESDSN
jgi:hypothetical protein